MGIRRALAGLAIAMAALLEHGPAQALSITATPLFVGTRDNLTGQRVVAGPDDGVGGGTLDSLVGAAASYWQGVIGDGFRLAVSYGWEKGLSSGVLGQTIITGSGTVHRATMAFSADAANQWFLDPTPPTPTDASGNSEFRSFSAPQHDLGGGTITTGLDYGDPDSASDAAGRFDLFSVILHELGHALGLANLFGLIDIGSPFDLGLLIRDPLPDAGSVIPICCSFDNSFSHIGADGALMLPSFGFGERRLPGDADILAIAQVDHFTDITLTAAADIPEPRGTAVLILGALVLHRVRRHAHR